MERWQHSRLFFYWLLAAASAKKSREQLQFIANASHELKTPITTIKTELKVIEMKKINKNLQDNFTVIQSESDNLQNLVNNLLAFNSAQTQPQVVQFNLENLIKGKTRQYQKIYQLKQLQFNLNCPFDYQLTSDPQKVGQILELLLDNAGKYATAKTQVQINVAQKKDKTQIQITNIGLGIVKEDQSKIFDRFYRVTDAQVQKENGSGLGLAIAQELSQEISAQLVLIDGSPANTTFSLLI